MNQATASVLLVDDEASLRKGFSSYLLRKGFDVETAATAAAATSTLQKRDFDVIVTDLKMPQLNGIDFIRELRAAQVKSEVIILTGAPDLTSSIRALKLDVFDYLTKPVSLEEFSVKISQACQLLKLRKEKEKLELEKEKYLANLEDEVQRRTSEVKLLYQKVAEIQEKERDNIAADIHDDLGQDLVVLNLRLKELLAKAPEMVSEDLKYCIELNAQVIDKTRTICHYLSSTSVVDCDLPVAIEKMVKRFSSDTLRFSTDLSALNNVVNPEWRLEAYRVFQEILTNVVKHAEASIVTIKARKRKKKVEITIKDNGRGFDKDKPTTGIGLRLIEERLKIMNATVEFKTSPRGTEVTIGFNSE